MRRRNAGERGGKGVPERERKGKGERSGGGGLGERMRERGARVKKRENNSNTWIPLVVVGINDEI